MSKKPIIIIFILLLIPFIKLSAQEEPRNRSFASNDGDLIDRFFTGGTIGLELGTATAIEADPIFGYKLYKDYLSVGIGGNYTYYRIKDLHIIRQQYMKHLYMEEMFLHEYIS